MKLPAPLKCKSIHLNQSLEPHVRKEEAPICAECRAPSILVVNMQ